MSLKKSLKCSAQAIVEYVVIYTVLLAGIVLLFTGFNPGDLKPEEEKDRPRTELTKDFKTATDNAVDHIREWK